MIPEWRSEKVEVPDKTLLKSRRHPQLEEPNARVRLFELRRSNLSLAESAAHIPRLDSTSRL